MTQRPHSVMIDDATFQDAKVAAAAYTMSISTLIRVALKTFLAGNGFVGKISSPPIPNPSAGTTRPATQPVYSEDEVAKIRQRNMQDYQARLESLRGKQPDAPNTHQRQMRPVADVTDVSQFSNAKR
jgi:hypothetical protein